MVKRNVVRGSDDMHSLYEIMASFFEDHGGLT